MKGRMYPIGGPIGGFPATKFWGRTEIKLTEMTENVRLITMKNKIEIKYSREGDSALILTRDEK